MPTPTPCRASTRGQIRQRERVEIPAELDLKASDLEQIVEAADGSYLALVNRAEWGANPGELARYIAQNNYPPRIRGTLRDARTDFWVELVADRRCGQPAESNEGVQLDAECSSRATRSVFVAGPCELSSSTRC